MLRRLYPEAADVVDIAQAYAVDDLTAHLRVNMVSSVDGAAAVDGRVGRLTGAADQTLLHALRALADVVLVGAGTLRAEGYGSMTLPEPWRRHRTALGQPPQPRLALLSRSLDLDLTSPVFTAVHPILVAPRAACAKRRSLAAQATEVAELVVVGEENVDLAAALEALARRGLRRVLSEGGPQVLGQLFAADLVDELCLTLSPLVVGGSESRISAGRHRPPAERLRLTQVLEEDEHLFLRYRRP